MATAVQKITLSFSRDIPFNKLVLSQANVRRVKAGVSIEELAEDIARRTLIQGLSVRPILDAEGAEDRHARGPGRRQRYRALELLVKQKRLAKTAPVPCVVRDANAATSAEEESLPENVRRTDLHPLDQVSRISGPAREGPRQRGDRSALLRHPDRGEATPAPRGRLADVARRLRRGRHVARPVHGVHRSPYRE
jgi:ParB family chromosome partitioning protein